MGPRRELVDRQHRRTSHRHPASGCRPSGGSRWCSSSSRGERAELGRLEHPRIRDRGWIGFAHDPSVSSTADHPFQLDDRTSLLGDRVEDLPQRRHRARDRGRRRSRARWSRTSRTSSFCTEPGVWYRYVSAKALSSRCGPPANREMRLNFAGNAAHSVPSARSPRSCNRSRISSTFRPPSMCTWMSPGVRKYPRGVRGVRYPSARVTASRPARSRWRSERGPVRRRHPRARRGLVALHRDGDHVVVVFRPDGLVGGPQLTPSRWSARSTRGNHCRPGRRCRCGSHRPTSTAPVRATASRRASAEGVGVRPRTRCSARPPRDSTPSRRREQSATTTLQRVDRGHDLVGVVLRRRRCCRSAIQTVAPTALDPVGQRERGSVVLVLRVADEHLGTRRVRRFASPRPHPPRGGAMRTIGHIPWAFCQDTRGLLPIASTTHPAC